MKKLYFLLISLFLTIALNAQWETVYFWGIPAQLPGLHAIQFTDYNNGMSVGVAGNLNPVIIRTNDAGDNWDTVYTSNSHYLLQDIEFTDTSTAIAIGYINTGGGIILKTTDYGDTWDSLFVGEIIYSVCFPNETIGYIVGYNGAIYKTIDEGDSWTQTTLGTSILTCLFFNNDTIGFVCSPNIIYKTIDGGINWIVSQTLGVNCNIEDIFFSSDSIGYCIVNDYTANERYLYKTIDEGDTWNLILTEQYFIRFSKLWFTDDNVGYHTGQFFERTTIDGGYTWIEETCTAPGEWFDDMLDVFFLDSQNGFIVGYGQFYRIGNGVNVDKIETAQIVSVYPNPTTGKIRVEAEGMESIEVFDIYGKNLKGFENHEGLTEIDLSSQPKGIYIIKVTTSNGVAVEKVVLE